MVAGSPKVLWVVDTVRDLKVDYPRSTVTVVDCTPHQSSSHLLNAHVDVRQLGMLRAHIIRRCAVPGQ